ncbi:MerR family transcriptional regulator [Micromonospora sp. Llam7]|uniref:DNA polymerase III subunit beta family protein n=1 Tax=Micromonospora tarapacensis TaxID=2835305 RepID=UPI001C834B6B|nr:MerR family transcriptional regulator [Micromonospora tarapacensis]MBX7265854.1 MerR family transcriptional regulator [Micromonospora tarapacensis]
MRSIGELARASGLTVSALRFYDTAGVLVPARVDPVTGYRRYTDDQVAPARLVAGLRRVGLPVVEIARAVRAEPAVVHRLLDEHLRRLADGLADARREVARIRSLLPADQPPVATRLLLAGKDLAAAVDAVRFAVGTDPDLPALAGVLLDVAGDGVRLVATDRHRLAVATADAAVHGPAVRALLPVAAADGLRRLLAGPAPAGHQVRLTVVGRQVVADVAGRRLRATTLPYDFPDYHALLPGVGGDQPARRVPVDAEWLVGALRAGRPTLTREYGGGALPVTVLGLGGRDALRLLGPDDLSCPGDPGGTELRVGVNGEYLLDALGAAGGPRLVLELDDPITPLAIRRQDDEGAFSILMPIRL